MYCPFCTAWSGESCPVPGSSHMMEGKEWDLFALFWPLSRFPKDLFLSCLIWSTSRNVGVVWISGRKPLKAVAGIMHVRAERVL